MSYEMIQQDPLKHKEHCVTYFMAMGFKEPWLNLEFKEVRN